MKEKTLILFLLLLSVACPGQTVARRSLPLNPFGNPLLPDMAGDPSIIDVDGTFYCYVTTDGYGQGLETSGPPVVWKSRDFVNWSFDGTYFPQAEHEKYWAPSQPVHYRGKWYMYPTVNGYMYPASADSPDGPFRLVKGDTFTLENRLLEQDGGISIDAEALIDDDRQRYVVWGLRHFAKLQEDMVTLDSVTTVPTRDTTYTEGPIFFKRKGIYYYLYTYMALERYAYYYEMSRESPFGPYTIPEQDLVCATDAEAGVFGPGHGCVFHVDGTDDYYLAYLEFGRNSTNRQVYVNKLEFNEDGTIRQVKVSMNGVGALRPSETVRNRLVVQQVSASSSASPERVPYTLDPRCDRTEYFVPEFAVDGSNGSRWMADENDSGKAWLMADLGEVRRVGTSRLAFVRPTAGHAYRLEGSRDGQNWELCGGHSDLQKKSPHEDAVNQSFRFLRVTITEGIQGIWEWQIDEAPTPDFADAAWIALDADSTILFPHVHLLDEHSGQARSLKPYASPVLSTSFRLAGPVEQARVDICGLGQYELSLCGKKVSEHYLSPGWTRYDRELLYNEYDVTDILRQAKSRDIPVRVGLGGGMYDIPVRGYHKMAGSCGAPKLLFCLHVRYTDGTEQSFVSDGSWKAEESPVRFASIYSGEWYDAGFRGSPRPVVITRPRWDVPLIKQQKGTFVQVRQELPAERIGPGLYDLHQNCSGIPRIRVKGKKGQSVILRPAEILVDGKISQRSQPGYEWRYTLGSRRAETWQPSFSYTGFRYVEVVADPGVKVLELTGLHTTTDAPETGSFASSDTLFNRIHSLIDWAIRSNLVSITTDCPTREKLGWQEQNHLMANAMMYRYDLRALMNKIADDLADSQHPDGAIPTIAPEFTIFEQGSGFEDTPEWGASFILCPWYTWQRYGDDSAIRKHYFAQKRYIGYLASRAEDNILDYGLGDWFDIGPQRPGKAQLTSVALSATAMYHYLLLTMVQIAEHLGMDGDATRFAQMADRVKAAFNARFATDDDKVYENGSQTGLAMALYMGLVPAERHQAAVDALVRDIESRGYAITAGDIGYRYVVQALQQNGRSDVIWRMNRDDSIPGYAYQLKKGATALTESWQAYEDVSNNHMMLGHLLEWFYGGLGGITFETANHLVICPQLVGDITWVRTSVGTAGGAASCRWTRTKDLTDWTVEITIPEGTDAEVRLPDGRVQTVKAGTYNYSGSVMAGNQSNNPLMIDS